MRITRDNMLMDIALVAAERGTCSRLQVGAAVSKNGRVLTTGYNGAPSGLPHCEHFALQRGVSQPGWVTLALEQANLVSPKSYPSDGTLVSTDGTRSFVSSPGDSGCPISEHAERNAVAFAARYGLALDGAEMHVTHGPCVNCARVIVNAGIVQVTYLHPYRITDGVDLLTRAGVAVVEYMGDSIISEAV